ncbi:MAG: OmpH family outer membrane protein [Bacteroidales bacterium]
MMKKLPVILNAVLFVGLAVLYLLYFTGGKKPAQTEANEEINLPVEIDSYGIAYVNIDSVILNFEMYFDRRGDLMDRQQKSESELNTKGQAYERGARDFQDKVSKGLVTRATAAEMEQSLIQQQQALVDLRDRLSYELMEEEQVMNRQILNYITTYLEGMKEEYNFQYILGRSFGGPILYGDNALDITSLVLDGLNKKYLAEKAASAK